MLFHSLDNKKHIHTKVFLSTEAQPHCGDMVSLQDRGLIAEACFHGGSVFSDPVLHILHSDCGSVVSDLVLHILHSDCGSVVSDLVLHILGTSEKL